MTEEFIYERERDLLDYLRNNTVDPYSPTRSTAVTETFTATAGQTVFPLTNVLVKNVRDTITVNAVTKRKGYDYYVTYGEGNATTSVTLLTGALVGQAVVITYTYGSSIIEREFSRTDAKLPRIVMKFMDGSEDYAGLGDTLEDGLGSYFNVTYLFEIRAENVKQARELTSKLFNLCRKHRHACLFRNNASRAYDMQNFDFDPDKSCYIWMFAMDLQWEIIFQ